MKPVQPDEHRLKMTCPCCGETATVLTVGGVCDVLGLSRTRVDQLRAGYTRRESRDMADPLFPEPVVTAPRLGALWAEEAVLEYRDLRATSKRGPGGDRW